MNTMAATVVALLKNVDALCFKQGLTAAAAKGRAHVSALTGLEQTIMIRAMHTIT